MSSVRGGGRGIFQAARLAGRSINYNPDGGITMKRILIVLSASCALAGAGTASANEAMAKADGCLNCHAVDTKKVGPAFKEVAAKYKGKADAEATLVDKLSKGAGHPATKATPDDLKSIVKWVLSL